MVTGKGSAPNDSEIEQEVRATVREWVEGMIERQISQTGNRPFVLDVGFVVGGEIARGRTGVAIKVVEELLAEYRQAGWHTFSQPGTGFDLGYFLHFF